MTALQAEFRALALLLVLACGRATPAGEAIPEAEQGVWADLASTTRLQVAEVTGCRAADHVALDVAWELENIGRVAEVFNWRNKVVLDESGRRFFPEEGASTPELAPGQRSPRMINRYRLPAGLADARLAWGLYTEGKLQYRVRLHPPALSPCVTGL